MESNIKIAKEIGPMRDETSPARDQASQTKEKSCIRIKFEAELAEWSKKRPAETVELALHLTHWAYAMEKDKTTWELIEERIQELTKRKNILESRRPQYVTCRPRHNEKIGRSAAERWHRVTEEDIIQWLFEAPIADEWMLRFRQKF